MPRRWCGRCATRIADLPPAYLDTSVIVPLFAADALEERARRWRRAWAAPLLVSDLARAECAAALAKKLRTGVLSREETEAALSVVEAWARFRALQAMIAPEDLVQAYAWIRRLDLPLRAPDAIHIAAAQRLGATLVTFDGGMAAAARTLGLAVATA